MRPRGPYSCRKPGENGCRHLLALPIHEANPAQRYSSVSQSSAQRADRGNSGGNAEKGEEKPGQDVLLDLKIISFMISSSKHTI